MSAGVREDLLIRLKRAQEEHGHLSREILLEISRSLEISVSDAFGVSSFYSFLSTRPRGRNIIRVCGSVPCYLKKSHIIVESLADKLGIRPGETTADGRFSIEFTNCIGVCDTAPAMLINNDVHGDLTPRKIARILKLYE